MTLGYASYTDPILGGSASIILKRQQYQYIVSMRRNRRIEGYETVSSEQEGQQVAREYQELLVSQYGMVRTDA